MREYLSSLGLLGQGVVEHWKLAVSGTISSALGWVLPAAGMANVPARILWWVGIGLLLWAAFRAFHDMRLNRDALARRLEPKLSIVLGGAQRPFLQLDNLLVNGDHEQRIVTQRIWRVGIANTGGGVDGAALILERCIPLDGQVDMPFFYPDHSLRAMDRRCNPAGRFYVPAGDGPVVYVDIAAERVVTGGRSNNAYLQYAQEELKGPIPRGRYRLMLRLEAGEAPPVRKAIRLEYDNDHLVLRED